MNAVQAKLTLRLKYYIFVFIVQKNVCISVTVIIKVRRTNWGKSSAPLPDVKLLLDVSVSV